MWSVGVIALLGCVLASSAKADEVHLVGGGAVEGDAVQQGDNVIVEVESGEVTLRAGSVEGIVASEPETPHSARRVTSPRADDIKELIARADFYRDHDMNDREREALRNVIEIAPDHSEARARLGYVQTDSGWVTRKEQSRAQGRVRQDARQQAVETGSGWVSHGGAFQAQSPVQRNGVQLTSVPTRRVTPRVQSTRATSVQRQPLRRAHYTGSASYTTSAPSSCARGYAHHAPYSGFGPYTTYAPAGYAGSYPGYAPYATYAPSSYGGGYTRYVPSSYAGACGASSCSSSCCPRPAAAWPPAQSSFPIVGVKDPFSYFR